MGRYYFGVGVGIVWGLVAVACPKPDDGGLDCTAMGCSGEFVLNLSVDGLIEANYELTLGIDNETETCTFALPFDVRNALCSLDSLISMEGDVVRVKRYTAMGEHFETVQVSLFASELNVLSGSFDTQWSEPYYPNGEECDGDLGCRSGNVTVRVE